MFFAEANLEQVKEVAAYEIPRNLDRAEADLKIKASKGRMEETNLMKMAYRLEACGRSVRDF